MSFSVFVICSESNTEHLIGKYMAFLQTLAYCSNIEVNISAPPGCRVITISDKCEVHLLLKGLIDVSVEIVKLQKKIDFLLGTKKKLTQEMNVPDYDSKVPQDIQKNNVEKLSQTNVELDKLESVMATLKLVQ